MLFCLRTGWFFMLTLLLSWLSGTGLSFSGSGVASVPLEFPALVLRHGLTQGCPASCMLYIIAVDPLLAALERMPQLREVVGFVDDWSMGCKGISAMGVVADVIEHHS